MPRRQHHALLLNARSCLTASFIPTIGAANTPGDTIVYVPEAKAAWTGNMTGGIFGLALETDAMVFRDTLRRFINTLNINLIVPAHRSLAGP